MATPALLVKYGEIALRGGNRKIFEDMLIRSIKKRVEVFGKCFVKKDQGRFFVEWDENGSGGMTDFTKLRGLGETVANIFGLAGVCPCIRTDENPPEHIKELALQWMKEHHPVSGTEIKTFKVEASRADKSYPLTSSELAADVGEYLLKNIPGLKVDVKKPDIRLRIEIRSSTYIYSEVFKGPGGLPAGSGGKGILLLSGGFDSPVAGYMAARRGVALTCVYFHSPPYTSELAKEKVADLAARLSVYAGNVKLFIVPFTDLQLYLNEKVPEIKMTIFLKRAMLKTASVIAEKENAHALITGDSIGQVASQTMHSLLATESAADYPVLRPLCGMDKLEIMNMAQKIGTYDISVRPYADCCTLFVAKHPETKPSRKVIEGMEKKLTDLDTLINAAADNAELIMF